MALLLIDFISDFDFEHAEKLFPRALAAARAARELRRRARRAGVPVIYANDNFGRWRSDFRSLLAHCLKRGARGRPIAAMLRPDPDDYFVLKPKHSAFHSTTLDVLLAYLGTRRLILAGVAANNCVLFTAHDAYMRDFSLFVPRDCMAAESAADERYAARHMARVLKAETRPSGDIDLSALAR